MSAEGFDSLDVSPIPRNLEIPEEIDDVVRITPVLLTKDGAPMAFYVAPCEKKEKIQEIILVCSLYLLCGSLLIDLVY